MPYAAPGRWYIAVICARCHHRVILFPDLSEGKSDLGRTQFIITCPNCIEEGSYPAEHYEQPPLKLTHYRGGTGILAPHAVLDTVSSETG
jgi:hypothetical protein